jgi:hypothetical protein
VLLENEDLVMEEILAVKGIHTKIKINMKVFVEYCITHPTFTEQFINMGLKCPMHESQNPQMMGLTYIAADVLTCDHETLADLFILPPRKTLTPAEDEEIEEEIETDSLPGQPQPPEHKYRFLLNIFEYLSSSDLDENCVNYITKPLATLVRKKISEYL